MNECGVFCFFMGILLALLVKIVIVVVVEVADEERVSLTREILQSHN